MTPITVTAETGLLAELMDDAVLKLQTAIDLLCACNQLDESFTELDQFALTQIICDSIDGDITLEDLEGMSKSEIFRMCHQELKAVM